MNVSVSQLRGFRTILFYTGTKLGLPFFSKSKDLEPYYFTQVQKWVQKTDTKRVRPNKRKEKIQ